MQQVLNELPLEDDNHVVSDDQAMEITGSSSQTGSRSLEQQAIVERTTLPSRIRRSVVPDDYFVYYQEIEIIEGMIEDPATFGQAMQSKQSEF